MNNELKQKYEGLKKAVERLDSAIVAFSGGIDSALVLKVAYDALGDNAIAVTADSPSLPRRELAEAKKIARQIGARHLLINTNESRCGDYLKNPTNRCYYCKTELYTKLNIISRQLGTRNILNGTNFDDLSDYRPGLQAADENNISSPLRDAKLTKNEIRVLAKHLGMEIWDKPSSPCLSSRVPYGQEITLKKLAMVEEAENFIRDFRVKELRVRHFGNAARIEVNENDKPVINNNLGLIKKKFKKIGFDEVAVSDFRSGNLNVRANVRAKN